MNTNEPGDGKSSQLFETLDSLHSAARNAHKRLVLIAESGNQAHTLQRRLAARERGFGVTVTTLRSWVAELWALYGDGRRPVSPEEATVRQLQLVRATGSLAATPGILGLVAQAADQALPLAAPSDDLSATERTVAHVLQQYAHELEADGGIAYASMLVALAQAPELARYQPLCLVARDELSMLELRLLDAAAARFPSDEQQTAHPQHLQNADAANPATFAPATAGEGRATGHATPCATRRPAVETPSELSQLQSSIFNRRPGCAPIAAAGQVRIALASGVEAQRRNVHHALQAAIATGCRSVTVVAPNAAEQWRFSAPALQAAGVTCALRCRKPFADIDAGRALLDLCQLVEADRPDPMLDADYSYTPLAGIPYRQAFHLDLLHRGNRLITNSEVLSDLAGNAPDGLEGVINLAENDDLASAITLLTGWAARHYAQQPGYLAEQLTALAAAGRLCEAAAARHASQRAAVQTLENRTVAVNTTTVASETAKESTGAPRCASTSSVATAMPSAEKPQGGQTGSGAGESAASATPGSLPEPDAPETAARIAVADGSAAPVTVTFTNLKTAAEAAPGSTDAVIFAQLNAANYPVRNSEDSLTTLLGKWGVAPRTDAWATARRRFTRALRSARSVVVLQRATHDENADEAQPAVLFEEALGCYRADPDGKDDLDPALGIPVALAPFALTDGEERFVANTSTAPRRYQPCEAPVIGRITPEAQPLIVLPRTYGGRTYPGLDVSASQIESYLECPYQWFAKRRLKLDKVEEGFSALERGSFMHAIMEHFYRRFQEQVAPKVTADNLPEAREMMRAVFTEQAERQFTDPNLKPGVRYVPVNALEEKKRDRLLPQLQQYLEREARLLPAFRPRHFEWAFGQDRPFAYAGCNLTGAVDRIDVDDEGNAVVIDYKSSLSDAYRLHLDPNGRQAKEQAKQAEAARRAYLASHGGLEPPAEAPQFQLPAKMQALIYAKVVRDTLGLNVVASLYLNPLDGSILGAYDAQQVGPEQIPFAKDADARACAVPFDGIAGFDELIAASEQAVAERMAQLAAGEVFPHPHGPDACQYCPVGNCPQRLVERKR